MAEHALHELNGSACGQWEMLWCVTSHAKRVPRYRPKRRADDPRRHAPARRILRSAALLTGLGPLTWHGTYLRLPAASLGSSVAPRDLRRHSRDAASAETKRSYSFTFPLQSLLAWRPSAAHTSDLRASADKRASKS